MGYRKDREPTVLSEDQLIMCDWDNPLLGEVVTLSEACVLFGKKRNSLKNAVLTHKLQARRSFTGGDWLITLSSLINKYGKPLTLDNGKDILTWLKS